MKKVFFLLALAGLTSGSYAQNHELSGRWFLGVNFKAGKLNERISRQSFSTIYPGTVNYTESKLKIENDNPIGFDVQVGYYFSPKRDWGISTGLLYYKNESNYTLDQLHFEYSSLDFNKDPFRQVITSNGPIKETVSNTSMNIPLMINYRAMMGKWIGFTISGGAVYNVKIESTYTSTANFDYEAIYKIDNVNGKPEFVYDPSPAPHPSDWLITEAQYNFTKGDGQVMSYFQSLQDQGYNVGLDVESKAQTSTINHKKGAIGLLFQPSFNVKISPNFFFNLGGYYMYQVYSNTEDERMKMIYGEIGKHQSLLTNTIHRYHSYYGLNFGLSLHL